MDLTVRSYLQHVVVGVSGNVDRRTAPVLRERLLQLLNTEPPRVVLDLSDVGVVDPDGVAVIAEAQRGARLVGGWLSLVCPDDPSRDWLDGGVLPMMPRYTSIEQALAHEREAEPVGVGVGSVLATAGRRRAQRTPA